MIDVVAVVSRRRGSGLWRAAGPRWAARTKVIKEKGINYGH